MVYFPSDFTVVLFINCRESPSNSSVSSYGSSPGRVDGRADAALHETSYMEYLNVACSSIKACAAACRHWSAPYDGANFPTGTRQSVDGRMSVLSTSDTSAGSNVSPESTDLTADFIDGHPQSSLLNSVVSSQTSLRCDDKDETVADSSTLNQHEPSIADRPSDLRPCSLPTRLASNAMVQSECPTPTAEYPAVDELAVFLAQLSRIKISTNDEPSTTVSSDKSIDLTIEELDSIIRDFEKYNTFEKLEQNRGIIGDVSAHAVTESGTVLMLQPASDEGFGSFSDNVSVLPSIAGSCSLDVHIPDNDRVFDPEIGQRLCSDGCYADNEDDARSRLSSSDRTSFLASSVAFTGVEYKEDLKPQPTSPVIRSTAGSPTIGKNINLLNFKNNCDVIKIITSQNNLNSF